MLNEAIFMVYTGLLYGLIIFLVQKMSKIIPIKVSGSAGFSQPLEAMRGIAATMVFGAHTTMYFGQQAPLYMASSYFGAVGVMLFFFLTGNLFWGQVLSGRFDITNFYQRRIRRLVPAVTTMIAIVMFTDWLRAGLPIPTYSQMVNLVRNFSFGFGGSNDVFMPETYQRINVIWTLKWEWLFYLALPVAASFFRNPLALAAFGVAVITVFTDIGAVLTGRETEGIFILAFFVGAFFAYADRLDEQVLDRAARILGSPVFAALWVAVNAIYLFGVPVRPIRVHTLGLLFVSIGFFAYFWAAKHRPVNWVRASPVQIVGKMSYSFYLWHLAANWYVMKIATHFFETNTLFAYFILSAVMAVVVVPISMISYVRVEERFMAKPRASVATPANAAMP